MEYSKINGIFKRDPNNGNKFIVGDYSIPEFEILKDVKWEATEKIDGMNTRIELYFENGKCFCKEYFGKTDEAIIPPKLKVRLEEIINNNNFEEVFPNLTTGIHHVTLYGEGYGDKVQCGKLYLGDKMDFIGFDVLVDGVWLTRESIEDIYNKLNVDVVPLFESMTIQEAIDKVKLNPDSVVAERNGFKCPMEGYILKAPNGVLTRMRKRIITKIKYKDFKDE